MPNRKEANKEDNYSIDNLLNKRKGKILNWLKNPYNLTFLIIVSAIIILRFYYFWITKNQPLWWDESEYMSKAKAIAGLVQYDSASIRSPVFPTVMSLFFFLGISNEVFMRFIALFLPSLLVVFLSYLLIKEMYIDRRIAIISLVIMGFLWEHLFYSNRFHTENFALIFEFLALIVLYKCYLKNEQFLYIKPKYSLIFMLVFSIISFLFRPGNIMFLPALILFLLILNKDRLLTKKGLAIISAAALIILFSFIFTNIPQSFLKQYLHPGSPLGWRSLTAFQGFFESMIPNVPAIGYYAFIIGLLISIFGLVLIFDKILSFKIDEQNKEEKSDLFNLLLIISVIFTFVFIMRANLFEYRWFFPLLPALLGFTSKGIIFVSDTLSKLSKMKYLGIFLIIIFCLVAGYTQINHADQIIKMKINSYSEVRDAAIWMKQNSNQGEEILTISYPQTVYYSERKVFSYSEIENESLFDNYLLLNKPKFLEVSGFENHPIWINDWLTNNQNNTNPIKVYFVDKQKKQPILIIYELNY